MKIFDANISGSLNVSGAARFFGDLTVDGTINAAISGTSTNALSLNTTGSARFATTGSNLFTANQTISGSIIPSVNNAYDLGDATHWWKDIYVSTGSIFIGGIKAISTNSDGTIQVGTQVVQTSASLAAVGLPVPPTGSVGSSQSTIVGSQNITGSQSITGSLAVSGSLAVTGSLFINGTSYTAATSGTSGSSGSNGSSGTSGSSGSNGSSGTSGSSGSNGSSGTSITTSGTNNILTKFTSASTVGNSSITDNGTTVSFAGALGVGTATPVTAGLIRATNDVIAFYGSDERLKENIHLITGSLDILKQINGYYFDWKEMPGIHENEGHDIGVIAQEIDAVLPEIVTTRDNGYMAVKYEKLVALLIQTNKELLNRVEALEAKIK